MSDHWSTTDLARLTHLTPGRISQLIEEGVIRRGEEGFDKDQTMEDWNSYLRGQSDISAARRQNVEKKNELLQIEIDRAKGDVMPVSDVMKAWENIIFTVREKFLRLAAKISPRLPFCKSEAEMAKIVDDEIREVLFDISRTPDYQGEKEKTIAQS
jgi:hypothetical protein